MFQIRLASPAHCDLYTVRSVIFKIRPYNTIHGGSPYTCREQVSSQNSRNIATRHPNPANPTARLSFFSLCLSSAITYAPLAADFFVYYPATTSKSAIYTLTTTGLMISFTMAYMIGIGLASGIATNESYNAAYTVGAGALIVEGFSPLHDFGKFCAVVVALGLIGNTIAPTYCAGVDFQVLGRYAEKVPRVVWTTVAVVIYTVCALAGRSHLSEIFTNFLALMGYWVFIWVGILFEERHIFRCRRRRRCQRSISVNGSSVTEPYNWDAWNDPSKLPVGIAGFIAFGVGWVGAVLCMAQVWYIGPLAKLVGDYGADVGFPTPFIIYYPFFFFSFFFESLLSLSVSVFISLQMLCPDGELCRRLLGWFGLSSSSIRRA